MGMEISQLKGITWKFMDCLVRHIRIVSNITGRIREPVVVRFFSLQLLEPWNDLTVRDLWYSEGTINYYYGGQYFAVFLTKLTGSKVELTYNLMRTFVAAFAFVLPFSLVRQMSVDRLKGSLTGKKRCLPAVAGIIAGLSVSIAGNMHYVVFSKIIPWLQNLQEVSYFSSWLP